MTARSKIRDAKRLVSSSFRDEFLNARGITLVLYPQNMCGVVGLIGTPEASQEAFLALTTLQHRGQDAAGILTYDAGGFHRVKSLGLVDSVFTRENMKTLTGSMAIAHARYGTAGTGDSIEVQPFLLSYPFGLGMVHNGNLVNVDPLREELRSRARRHLLTHSDTEVILNLFAEGLARTPSGKGGDLAFEDLCTAVGEVFARANGSFSVVTLVADHGLVAFRDPHGIRPLIWGRRSAKRASDRSATLPTGESHIIASEGVALGILGYEEVRNIRPGEVIFIDLQGRVHSRIVNAKTTRHCMFEWIYFASPESVIDNVPVYGTRIHLGRNLAPGLKKRLEEKGIVADLIVPVPETSRIAAIALAEEMKLPYREVLIKNRYIKRTFILDTQDKRQAAVSLKLSPVRSEIEGKRVILVDDSIVRGTTSRKIIELVRQAGAAAVYFVSTCPPIRFPCFYGIDFPDRDELIAHGRTEAEIERELGADAVVYQDVAGLQRAIHDAWRAHQFSGAPMGAATSQAESGISPGRPCMACLDGQYPTDVSSAGGMAASRARSRGACSASAMGAANGDSRSGRAQGLLKEARR